MFPATLDARPACPGGHFIFRKASFPTEEIVAGGSRMRTRIQGKNAKLFFSTKYFLYK
jgi:hypothetical protein